MSQHPVQSITIERLRRLLIRFLAVTSTQFYTQSYPRYRHIHDIISGVGQGKTLSEILPFDVMGVAELAAEIEQDLLSIEADEE